MVQQISRSTVQEFVGALSFGENLAPTSIARKVRTLRGLFENAIQHELIRSNPAAGIRINVPRKPVLAPSEAELLKLIRSVDTRDWMGKRDAAYLWLLYDCCLRISEPLTLDIYNPRQPPKCCVHNDIVRTVTKGGDIHTNAITSAETRQALLDWQQARAVHPKATKSAALFINNRGERLGRGGAHQRVKLWADRAGLPHVHSHLFRHARLRDVLTNTGDVRLASHLANHKRASTTLDNYGHLAGDVMAARLRKLAPLGAAA
jgi:site-specific recombinase XerD